MGDPDFKKKPGLDATRDLAQSKVVPEQLVGGARGGEGPRGVCHNCCTTIHYPEKEKKRPPNSRNRGNALGGGIGCGSDFLSRLLAKEYVNPFKYSISGNENSGWVEHLTFSQTPCGNFPCGDNFPGEGGAGGVQRRGAG